MVRRIIKCERCGKYLPHCAKNQCVKCYSHTKYLRNKVICNEFNFSAFFMGERINAHVKGEKWADIKKWFDYKKEEILQDCIDNPNKYLSDLGGDIDDKGDRKHTEN